VAGGATRIPTPWSTADPVTPSACRRQRPGSKRANEPAS
jgi:hypothetical protein